MRIIGLSPRFRGHQPDTLLLLRSAAALLAALLVWLGWIVLGSAEAVQHAARQSISVTELRGRIALLSEHLTMSARMAAESGNPSWIERYDSAVPGLEAAIAEAAALTTPKARPALSETLIEAHRDLSQMQRRALFLTQANLLGEARSLLGGAEFAYLENVYTGGLDVFGRDIEVNARERAEAVRHRSWMRTVAFGATAIMLVVTLMAARHRVRLRDAAGIDPLTQLPNRHRFYAALSSRLERRSVPDPAWLALVIVGIDHFKAVNDTFGHAVADMLLQRVTARLRALACPGVVVARVGGDEFALLFDTALPPFGKDCPSLGLMAALAEPYRLNDGSEVTLGFSAGAVWIGGSDAEAGDLLRQAGGAFRQAKADGRGCLRVFDHLMDARSRDQTRLGADLRSAIDQDAIVPFFQPLVDLQTGRVIGVEALARWNHAERGWVSPADFIPLAEELGLIDALMQRLLRRACSAALDWPAEITVAFNVSPLQLRDGALPERIRAILAETGFPAQRLEIEVTESALVTDLEFARGLLEDLRQSGVRLALDDFGTGYSSLKHLRCLPFDKLKIDASFVGGMVDDSESRKIVAAVIGLGHSLGLSTVAEGVETPQVAALLQELGCDIGQGWLFGRPVLPDDLAFLAAMPRAA